MCDRSMSRFRRILIPLFRVLGLTSGALARESAIHQSSGPQPQDVPAQVAAMSKLNFMVGRWKGSGWNLAPDGTKQNFNQTETATRKVGGTITTVDAEGRDPSDRHRAVDSTWHEIGEVTVDGGQTGTRTSRWTSAGSD